VLQYAQLLTRLEGVLRKQHSLDSVLFYGADVLVPPDMLLMLYVDSWPWLPEWCEIVAEVLGFMDQLERQRRGEQ
jgi:hypothetical protein